MPLFTELTPAVVGEGRTAAHVSGVHVCGECMGKLGGQERHLSDELSSPGHGHLTSVNGGVVRVKRAS